MIADARGLPESEQVAVDEDLARIRKWLHRHPEVHASVAVDRIRFDAGQGNVLLVVSADRDVDALRRDLETVVRLPERLRVRADHASLEDLERVLRCIVETRMGSADNNATVVTSAGIDEQVGAVVVTLNRVDPRYVDDLQARSDGLVQVEAEPLIPVRLEPPTVDRNDRWAGPVDSP